MNPDQLVIYRTGIPGSNHMEASVSWRVAEIKLVSANCLKLILQATVCQRRPVKTLWWTKATMNFHLSKRDHGQSTGC